MLITFGTVVRMLAGGWARMRRYGLWSGAPAVVAGAAGWAALADNKQGWTVVAAAVAGAVGAFCPTVADRVAARRERRLAAAARKADVVVKPVSVTWLLRPDQRVVPFFGRGWLLAELQTWATDQGVDVAAVRLLTGAGGVGKTRLAQELEQRLAGWRCEWISPHEEEQTARLVAAGEFPLRSLLVIDYAEARDRAGLAQLLCAVQTADRVRIVLLARTAGLWWETLSMAFSQQAALVDSLTSANDVVVHVAARVDDVHDPATIVAEAVTAFASRLGRPVPELAGAPGWPADTPVLRLHADALVTVLEGAHRQGRYDVLVEVLKHESRYWMHTARRSRLLGEVDDPANAVLLEQVAGIAALLGAESAAEVEQVVRRVPLLAGAEDDRLARFGSWLAGLYPRGEAGLGVVQPDLLAETLAARVIDRCGPVDRARVFADLTVAQAVRALTVLGRARIHYAGADALIDAALGVDVACMAEAVVHVGVQFPGVFTSRMVDRLASAEVDHRWACEVAGRVPYPSLELRWLALELTSRIVAGFPADAPKTDRAHWATWHALRLAEVG
ncbi:hypothetical protein, partial [Actinoplanes derwentensis]|uniref:hypothetical protein n=1 Tax=Actinoplanes derwentensis TaxID=113562 RepID=UPI001940C94B